MTDTELRVFIQNERLRRVDEDIEFNVTNAEEGDSLYGVFTSNTPKEYTPYTSAHVDYLGKTYEMVVEQDEFIQLNPETFIHKVRLKSAIFYFDSVFPPSRVFTQVVEGKNKTIAEILKIYAETSEQGKVLFNFDENFDKYQERITEKEYDGENLSTILKDIFRRIDAFPMLRKEGNSFYLYPRFIGELKGNEPISISPKSKQSTIDTTEYSTRVTANIKNAIYENNKGTWFPSKNGSITPRTEDLVFSQTNARYFLDNDIIWIYEAIVKDAIKFTPDMTDTTEGLKAFWDLDVSERFIPRKVYDLKFDPPSAIDNSSDNQSNYIPYEIGTNSIGPLWREVNAVFTDARNILYNTMFKHLDDNFEEIRDEIREEYPDAGDFEINQIDLAETPMRFRYLSSRDISYTIEKQDVIDAILSTIKSNQRSSTVEIRQHKRALSRLANRLGEKNLTYIDYFRKGEKPPEIGEWTEDGYKVTKVKYLYSPMKTKCTFQMNKNFSNIDAESGISRNPEPFTITGKRIQTNTQTHEYIEISEKKKEVDSYLTELGRNVVLNVLNYNSNHNKPIESSFYTRQNELPLNNHPLIGGGDNAITIHNQFKDETLAYTGVRKNEINTLGTWQRHNVRYTDDDGVVDLFSFKHVHGYEYHDDIEKEELTYPMVEELSGEVILDLQNINIQLDPNASLAHTHNIHFVTDYPDKIINTGGFSEINNLHTYQETGKQIKIYYREQPYNLTDIVLSSQDIEDEEASISYNDRELSIIKSSNYKYWCLVIDEVILFAYNKDEEITKNLYINFTKKRQVFLMSLINLIGERIEQPYNISGNIETYISTFNLTAEPMTQNYNISGNIETYISAFDLTAETITQTYHINGGTIDVYVSALDLTPEAITQTYNIQGNIEVIPTIELNAQPITQSYNVSGNIEVQQTTFNLIAQPIRQGYNVEGEITVQQLTYNLTPPRIIQSYNVEGQISAELPPREWVLTSDTNNDVSNTYTVDELDPCPTSSYINDWLTSRRDPNNQDLGTICRVVVNHPQTTCDDYYYIVQEI